MEDVLQSDRLIQLVRSQATFQQKGLQLQEALEKRTGDLAVLQAEAKERFGTDNPVQLAAIAERMRLWVQEVIKFDERAHKVVDACLGALKEGGTISPDTLQELSNLAQIQHGLMEAASNNSFQVGRTTETLVGTPMPTSACDPAFRLNETRPEIHSSTPASGKSEHATTTSQGEQLSATADASSQAGQSTAEPAPLVRRNTLRSNQRRLQSVAPAPDVASTLSSESQPKSPQNEEPSIVAASEPPVSPLLVATGGAVINDGKLSSTESELIPQQAPEQVPESTVIPSAVAGRRGSGRRL